MARGSTTKGRASKGLERLGVAVLRVNRSRPGRLGDKVRIVAFTPRLAAGQIDLVLAQKAPDVLLVNVAERGRPVGFYAAAGYS